MGLPVEERVYCPACELVSHRSSYTQHFYNAQVSALEDGRQRGGRSWQARSRGTWQPPTTLLLGLILPHTLFCPP